MCFSFNKVQATDSVFNDAETTRDNLKSLLDSKNYSCYAAGYWVVTEKDECRSSYPTTTVNIMP